MDEVLEINKGSLSSPKILNIRKNSSKEEQREIETFVHEYKDAFPWTYDDFKTYDESIIQHTIPLKEGASPYRKIFVT